MAFYYGNGGKGQEEMTFNRQAFFFFVVVALIFTWFDKEINKSNYILIFYFGVLTIADAIEQPKRK